MPDKVKPTTPQKAIKAFCIECFGGKAREVKGCTAINCPLYEFRRGKNPYCKREVTEEQREKSRARMKEYWETRGAK